VSSLWTYLFKSPTVRFPNPYSLCLSHIPILHPRGRGRERERGREGGGGGGRSRAEEERRGEGPGTGGPGEKVVLAAGPDVQTYAQTCADIHGPRLSGHPLSGPCLSGPCSP